MIAHVRNRVNLSETLEEDIKHVYFTKDTLWHRMIWRAGQCFPDSVRDGIFGTLLNLLNEHYIVRLIRSMVAAGEIDVIHQPIPVSPKTPSSLYNLGIPVVIGPMNGGMTYPPGYENLESPNARRFVASARVAALLVNRLIPGKRKAAALLVANERTRVALPIVDHPRVITLVENGVDLSVWRPSGASVDRSTRQPHEPFRLVFIGRLIALKAVDITLDALRIARAEGEDVRLDIFGDGDVRAHLEAQVAKFGLGQFVRFHGFRTQDECALFLSRADGLILNSVHECGGAVVLEAMSMGLPVIVSDWGGPADYVDSTCGILVPPAPRDNFATGLAAAIVRLAKDPLLARAMGVAGREKVERQFDWEIKIDQMLTIYRDALDAKTNTVSRN